jgi:hypothetical protein
MALPPGVSLPGKHLPWYLLPEVLPRNLIYTPHPTPYTLHPTSMYLSGLGVGGQKISYVEKTCKMTLCHKCIKDLYAPPRRLTYCNNLISGDGIPRFSIPQYLDPDGDGTHYQHYPELADPDPRPHRHWHRHRHRHCLRKPLATPATPQDTVF